MKNIFERKGMFVISLNNRPTVVVYNSFIQLCSKCLKQFKIDVQNMDYRFYNITTDLLGRAIYESYNIEKYIDLPFCVMCHVNPTEYLAIYELEVYSFRGVE